MKKHLVTLLFNTPGNQENYYFSGLVTGKELPNGKVVVSYNKIFKKAFGFECPAHTTVTSM